ncbi:MAG: adenylosuccinate lyase, partial [Acidimicrobiia bacterium]|nr:adenylosuccinate lyase [Acidimicrobiia bacterium]
GMGREEAHAVIREHALAVAESVRDHGRPNDLLDRLAADPRLPVDADELAALVADPAAFTGAAGRQVATLTAAVATVVARHPVAANYQPAPIL